MKRTCRASSFVVVGTLVALLATTGAGNAAAASKDEKSLEEISARVVSLSAGPGPNTGMVYIWVDAYTSDDDARRWVDVLTKDGQDALVELWQKEEPEVGRVRLSGTIAYGLRSMDYPLAWIELDVDSDGKGTGRMIPAVELTVEENTLQIKSLGVEPLRLMDVKVKTH